MRTISDGSSNTIVIEEGQRSGSATTPTRKATAPTVSTTTATTQESTVGEVRDGSSNTFLFGERPANGIATGDGASTVKSAPAVVVSAGDGATASTKAAATGKAAPATSNDVPAIAGGRQLTCAILRRLQLLARLTLNTSDRKRLAAAVSQYVAASAQLRSNRC